MALNKERKEQLLQEMEQFKQMHTKETMRAHLTAKNQFKNLDRIVNSTRQELQYEQQQLKDVEDAAVREKALEDEQKLAIVLDKVKRDELKEIKLRQHLRENSHELRELESKLRAAYAAKELAAQIAEKKQEKLRNKIEDKQNFEILQSARIKEEELNRTVAEAELKKKLLYKQELQDQIILQEKTKRYKYEEFLQEKKMLDDIIQRIHEEDERELQNKYCQMLKTRDEMNAFKIAQEVWRRKQKDELELENRRIQEYMLSKALALNAQLEEKKRRDEIMMKISENIAKKTYEDESKKREREEIIQELLQEEQKEAIERRHREEVEKEIRQRIEVRESLTRQMQERQERRQQEAREDAKYKEQLIAKLAEDQKLEQLTQEKKRLKMIQLRKDVEEIIMQRRQAYAEDMQLNMRLVEQAEQEQRERMRVIEEERMRMLREHAHNLIGFIPPGVLKPDDLPLLGSDVMGAYKIAN